MVTVILGTADRPAFLHQALASIQAQTARDAIAAVIVSENGGNPASRQVCADFPGLPISYRFQQPALSPREHGMQLLSEGRSTPYVAILHDDDFWADIHLAQGLRAMEGHRDVVAHFSSFLRLYDDSSHLVHDPSLEIWFGLGFPNYRSPWLIDRSAALLCSLPRTPVHFSTSLVRADVLTRLIPQWPGENNFDTDRTFLPALAQHGAVAFSWLPDVVVREHSQRDALRHPLASRLARVRQTTREIIRACEAAGIDLREELDRRVRECPAPSRRDVYFMLIEDVCARPLLEAGLWPTHLPKPAALRRQHRFRRLHELFMSTIAYPLVERVSALRGRKRTP